VGRKKAKGRKKPVNDKPKTQRTSAYGTEGERAICINAECKLRKQGCRGFEGCPGYMAR
jgi:hypothetical protein